MGVQERQSHDKQIYQISEKNYKNKQTLSLKITSRDEINTFTEEHSYMDARNLYRNTG